MSNYNLTDLASNEWKEFASYTIESRAIPSMIDGMKPVQRFYIYSSIKNSAKEFKKVSAVSGVVSDYGYNHGESSAASAGQLMAATWNNNVCLVEGRGSFGTRLVQEAGAPRYVYTRLHENFKQYIKDIELSPKHDDPEHEPPRFYIPIIPLVLANGTRGIATGFATNILPRSAEDLAAACKEYLTTGDIRERLPIAFPDFKGTTELDVCTNKAVCRGTFERPTSTKIIITEVPYGYDRESYIGVLDKIDDDGDILGYEDQCSSEGFQFEVKLRNALAKQLNTDEKVIKYFKLEKSHSENMTVIGPDGHLKEYSDERDLIKDFVYYRLGVLDSRIDNEKRKVTEESRWLNVKKQFIVAVLDDKIVFKNKKKDDVSKQILSCTDAIQQDINRLLSLNIMSLTKEMVVELDNQIKQSKADLKYWSNTTNNEQFLLDLEELV